MEGKKLLITSPSMTPGSSLLLTIKRIKYIENSETYTENQLYHGHHYYLAHGKQKYNVSL
jgi:hypothetical protein